MNSDSIASLLYGFPHCIDREAVYLATPFCRIKIIPETWNRHFIHYILFQPWIGGLPISAL